MRERTHRLLLRSLALAVASWTILPVSAQRSDQREILFDSRMGPTPASPGLGTAKGQEIWVIRSDGSGLRRLTKSPSEDTRNQVPRWSPDGAQIAFSSTRHAPSPENTDAEIYVMNFDGSGLRRVTYGPRGTNTDADWSPDGRRLAFVSNRDGNFKIYVVNADGSNLRRLTTDQMTPSSKSETGPAWSSDGKRIAFQSNRDREENEIYILNMETSTIARLTENDAWDAHPAWSPDSQYLSFDSTRDGNWEIYLMRPDGSQVVRVTNHPRMDNAARWSRDGQRLVFNSTRDSKNDDLANCELYVMNRDGSGLRRLTNNSVKDTHPDW